VGTGMAEPLSWFIFFQQRGELQSETGVKNGVSKRHPEVIPRSSGALSQRLSYDTGWFKCRVTDEAEGTEHTVK
jgi:hypothetical protein